MALGAAILVGTAADPELAGAAEIEVYERAGQFTTYRLRYALDITDGDFPLLKDARLGPGSTLTIVAEIRDQQEVLVKGPVYAQHVHLGHGGAGSFVDVMGADNSIKMAREAKTKAWGTGSESTVITQILTDSGFKPDVEATNAMFSEQKHFLVQRDSDLSFVRRVARRHGKLFWVTADAAGIEIAHFKKPPLDGEPTVDLIVNLDNPPSNVEAVEITWDVERPTSTVARQADLFSSTAISGSTAKSTLTALGDMDLAAVAPGTRSAIISAPADDVAGLQGRSDGLLLESTFFIRARCSAVASAVGKIVRSHTLVNLRGAGSRHSGKYFCKGVRHVIDSTAHVMEIELVRNAWGA